MKKLSHQQLQKIRERWRDNFPSFSDIGPSLPRPNIPPRHRTTGGPSSSSSALLSSSPRRNRTSRRYSHSDDYPYPEFYHHVFSGRQSRQRDGSVNLPKQNPAAAAAGIGVDPFHSSSPWTFTPSYYEKMTYLHELVDMTASGLGVETWTEQKNNAGLIEKAMDWLEHRECKNENDYINFGSWGELLSGVRDGQYENCFLGGSADLKGFIDSEMVQFAGMQWLVASDNFYLFWLGFSRRVEISQDSCILHASGNLFELPKDKLGAYRKYSVGSVWSIGALLDSFPTAEEYARVYLKRAYSLKVELNEEGSSCPSVLLSKIKVRNSRNRGSYRMRLGEDRFRTMGFTSCVELSVLTFSSNGLKHQKVRRLLKKVQEGSLSTEAGATLRLASEDVSLDILTETVFQSPLRQLKMAFSIPKVLDILRRHPLLTTSELALAHVLAGAHSQTGSAALCGEGLCAVGHGCRTPLWAVGPVTLDVAVASGWTVSNGKVTDWSRETVDLDHMTFSNDNMRRVGMKDVRSKSMVMCKGHIGDTEYWRRVAQVRELVAVDDDEERERRVDLIMNRKRGDEVESRPNGRLETISADDGDIVFTWT